MCKYIYQAHGLLQAYLLGKQKQQDAETHHVADEFVIYFSRYNDTFVVLHWVVNW